jgi:hypothetical protein
MERSQILRLFIVVVVLIAAVLAYAATKPNTFAVQRSRSITGFAGKNLCPDQQFPRLEPLGATGQRRLDHEKGV